MFPFPQNRVGAQSAAGREKSLNLHCLLHSDVANDLHFSIITNLMKK